MHNARKLERKERTEEGRAFVNIFLSAIYKLGIALEENVTFFTSAKSEKYKPSTAQDMYDEREFFHGDNNIDLVRCGCQKKNKIYASTKVNYLLILRKR